MNNEFNNQNMNQFQNNNVNSQYSNDYNSLNNQNSNKGCNNGLIVALVIIIIALVGFCLFFALDKKDSEVDSSNNDNNIQENNKSEQLSIYSQVVTEVMDLFNRIYISKEELYKNSIYNIETISNHDLIATSVKNIGSENIAFCVGDKSQLKDSVSFNELNNVLSNYILNKSINIDNIKLLGESSYPIAQYEASDIGIIVKDNSVQLVGSCGAVFTGEDFIKRSIEKAEKNNNYIYIYEKQAFGEFISDPSYMEDYSVNYYKEYDKKTKIETKTDDQDTLLDWKLYNTYKYTFKLINDKYYFQSIELLEK